MTAPELGAAMPAASKPCAGGGRRHSTEIFGESAHGVAAMPRNFRCVIAEIAFFWRHCVVNGYQSIKEVVAERLSCRRAMYQNMLRELRALKHHLKAGGMAGMPAHRPRRRAVR